MALLREMKQISRWWEPRSRSLPLDGGCGQQNWPLKLKCLQTLLVSFDFSRIHFGTHLRKYGMFNIVVAEFKFLNGTKMKSIQRSNVYSSKINIKLNFGFPHELQALKYRCKSC
jgi:hypothetical protein